MATKAETVEKLTKSVRLLVDLQWDLADLGTLDKTTKEGLLLITEYHLMALAATDQKAAEKLILSLPTKQDREKDLTGN